MDGPPTESAHVPPRDLQPELMDDPALSADEHRRALRGLTRLNALSGSANVLWPAVRKLARELGRPVRILDVATGAGDVPLQLCVRAARAGFQYGGCRAIDKRIGRILFRRIL